MSDVFVFGSNTQGRHGKGAALHAKKYYGAVYGQASGRQGNSYAIITKELRPNYPPVTLADVEREVSTFLEYIKNTPDDLFHLTKIGCGLAGFVEEDIKGMFKIRSKNLILPEGWYE